MFGLFGFLIFLFYYFVVISKVGIVGLGDSSILVIYFRWGSSRLFRVVVVIVFVCGIWGFCGLIVFI